MQSITVSIIIPAYNSELYLSRCLDSCIEQTFTKTEIIIINDGSTDKTEFICKEYSCKFKHVNHVLIKHSGASFARNLGIKMAKGEYILFVDADDYIDKNMVSVLYNHAKKTNADIAICDFKSIKNDQITNSKNLHLNDSFLEGPYCGILLLKEIYTPTCWNKLFKKNFIVKNKIEFPENIISGHDFLFALSTFILATSVVCINQSLYNYCYNYHSLSNNITSDHLIGYKTLMEITDTYFKKNIEENTYINEFISYYKSMFNDRVGKILCENLI